MEKAVQKILTLGFVLLATLAFTQTDYSYSGQVFYHNNYPLSDVTVTLTSPDGNFYATAVTDNTGTYQFTNVPAGTYNLSFGTDKPAGGVDLEDAYLIELYLAGQYQFNEIQALAADVNGNGVINNGDRMAIIHEYLNMGNPFPIGDWVFEDETITIPDSGGRTGDLKLGSSSGDVNGSLQPDPKSCTVFMESPALHLSESSTEPLKFDLTCPINASIAGMHLVFMIPEDLEISDLESPFDGVNFYESNGMVRITFLENSFEGQEIDAGTTLVSISARPTARIDAGNSYHMALKDESHLIDSKGEIFPVLQLSMPTIMIDKSSDFYSKAYPNPFINNVRIEFNLKSEGNVTLAVFDQYGRQLEQQNLGFMETGIQQISIEGNSFAPGIYNYCISCANDVKQIEKGTIIKSN